MIVICAWCGQVKGPDGWSDTPVPGYMNDQDVVSHGICVKCKEGLINDTDRSETATIVDLELSKAQKQEAREYKLAWRDLMDRERYTEANDLTGKYFFRGVLTARQALADVEAVKIALELNERKLRN